jgi:hypothetical protein
MSITYTWKLTSFKKVESSNMLSNIIFQTHWEKIGTDEHGNTGRFIGATPFDSNKVDPDKFIPYESLSEEIVLGWIKPIVVGDYERHANEQIAKEIQTKIDVVVEIHPTSFPWSTGTVYVPPPAAPV